MTRPFGLGPNAGVLLPSGLTLSTEITVQDPTKSLAVCATATAGSAAPKHRTTVVLSAIEVREFIVFSLRLRSGSAMLLPDRPPFAVSGSERVSTRRLCPVGRAWPGSCPAHR